MKLFVAIAALVAVAVANPARFQQPSILPAMVENPALLPALVEEPVYQQPAFGPALIDFPLNSDGTLILPEAPVAVPSPVPAGASPLVQIIVNVGKPAAEAGVPAEAGPGLTNPSIEPEYVMDPVEVVDDVPVVIDPVQVVDLPIPVEPIQIGNPQLPPVAVNIPGQLN